MRLLWICAAAMMLVGCETAEKVAGIHRGLVDPTGVKSLIHVGDSRLQARAEMGKPDRVFLSKSGRLDAMVFYREDHEAIVVFDHYLERVLRVHNAKLGWMDQGQIERIESELFSA